ncbi:DUF1653 domain-containing protein [Candidatus Shapirobacteria bacterium CG09_land_8_20_14_0_10_39_12]|uniref:DUF1653 domain-containing protein n=1 Tax=Candidatus Shapirobacteria bacterium CG09_land_8_20_14_0_10_39_12 TaxID=1974885 RepID=A0A2H0WQ92_9BACT|nr:MAG: DUF1653 domain-containing protein [Candidatus Shapirobacteria bacterium CG09_land_8_20_14_0_10_39_12]
MREIKIGGKYKHYKGNLYEVIMVARDSDNPKRELVVYRGLYDSPEFGKNPVWVRSKEDFLAKVTEDGKTFFKFEEVMRKTE